MARNERRKSSSNLVLASFIFVVTLSSLFFCVAAIISQITIFPFYKLSPAVSEFLNWDYSSLPSRLWILIAISGFTALFAVICFFCTVLRKNDLAASTTFYISLILVGGIISEQIIAKQCYNIRTNTTSQIISGLNSSLPLYDNVTDITHFWDDLQSQMTCCGVEGPQDWAAVFNTDALPDSCCSITAEPLEPYVPLGHCTPNSTQAHLQCCGHQVKVYLMEKSIIMYSICLTMTIVVALIAIAHFFVGCCCKPNFNSDYEPL